MKRLWRYECKICGRTSASINRKREFCVKCIKKEKRVDCVKCGNNFAINEISEKRCWSCLGVSKSRWMTLKWKVKKWHETSLNWEKDIRILKVKKDAGELSNFDYLMVCHIWMTCVSDEMRWKDRKPEIQVRFMIDELWLSLKILKGRMGY